MNDLNIALAFLEALLPGTDAHNLVFAHAVDGTPHDAFPHMPIADLWRILPMEQADGKMLFVEAGNGVHVAVAGQLDLRTASQPLLELEDTLTIARACIASNTSEWVKPRGASDSADADDTPARGISDANRRYLETRGLEKATIDLSGAYSESDSKQLAKLLKRMAPGVTNALVLPHARSKNDASPVLRMLLEGAGGASVAWANGAPVPYLPKEALEDGRFSGKDLLYVTLDVIDALAISQLGYASVGADSVDSFRDAQHFMDTGEEVLHGSVPAHRPVLIFYYPRTHGKRRPDALRIARLFTRAGAPSANIIDVGKDGNLRNVVGDSAAFQKFTNKMLPVVPDDLESPFTLLKDVLPADVLAHPLFESARGLYVPETYDIDPVDGGIYTEKAAGFANGVAITRRVCIARTPVIPVNRVRDVDTGTLSLQLAFFNGTDWVAKHVPIDGVTRKRDLTYLARWGVAASDHNNELFIGWLHNMLELNQQHSRFKDVHGFTRTGWHTLPNGEKIFAMPNVTPGVFTTPSVMIHGDNEHLVPYGKISGTWEGQREALSILALNVVGRVQIMEMLRSTIIPLLGGQTTRHTHVYGTTTKGKTLSTLTALAIYGDPRALTSKGNTTLTAVEMMLAARQHSTTFLDEVTNVREEARTDLLYLAADGCGKGRATRDNGIAPTRRWTAGLITTGEKPVGDYGMAAGAAARVLELNFEGLSEEHIQRLLQLKENYGHAIHRWIPVLHTLLPRVAELTERLNVLYAEGRAHAKKNQENSRTADHMAELILTHEISYGPFGRDIGIPDDGGDGMAALLYSDLHLQATAKTEPELALEALQTFVLTNPNQVITSSTVDHKGPVIARIDEMTGSYRFERGWLTNFIKRAGFSAPLVRAEWKKAGLTKDIQPREGGARPHYIVFRGKFFEDTTVHNPTLLSDTANVSNDGDATTEEH